MLWLDRPAFAHTANFRAFRLGDGELRQITEDHSTGKLFWDAGILVLGLARYVDERLDRSADLGCRTCVQETVTCRARAG